jgi:hypothetical protein
MLYGTIMAFVATGMIAAAPSPQFWGSAGTPRNGACFYRDANYRGEYFCVESGRDMRVLPDEVTDEISSMRIFGKADVTVFVDRDFRGRSQHFTSDVSNLRKHDLNDKIASIRVKNPGFGGWLGSGSGTQNPDVIVRRAYEDVLGRQPDPEGMRVYRSHIIDDGWTERDVRDALRKSGEYRERTTMTYEKAQDIVRRAYQAVLKREPDAGSRGYVDKVMRDKWTQADVERELKKSPEYRKR